MVSSPCVERLRLDLEVTDKSKLLELVLVFRRKCSSKSGRPARCEMYDARRDEEENENDETMIRPI